LLDLRKYFRKFLYQTTTIELKTYVSSTKRRLPH